MQAEDSKIKIIEFIYNFWGGKIKTLTRQKKKECKITATNGTHTHIKLIKSLYSCSEWETGFYIQSVCWEMSSSPLFWPSLVLFVERKNESSPVHLAKPLLLWSRNLQLHLHRRERQHTRFFPPHQVRQDCCAHFSKYGNKIPHSFAQLKSSLSGKTYCVSVLRTLIEIQGM